MKLLTELRRRNVTRGGVLYAVASWLILQVADVLFGVIGVPEWSLGLVAGILVLGFPLALVILARDEFNRRFSPSAIDRLDSEEDFLPVLDGKRRF